MNGPVDTVLCVMPSALPDDADIGVWQGLPRDEQLRRLQAKLTHPDCATVSAATMSDILARAQAADKVKRGSGFYS